MVNLGCIVDSLVIQCTNVTPAMKISVNITDALLFPNCTFSCLWIMSYCFLTSVAVDSQCLACELHQSSPETLWQWRAALVTPTGAAEEWGRGPWILWPWWSAGQEGVSLVAQCQFLALLPFPQEEGGRSGPQQIYCWITPQKRLDLSSLLFPDWMFSGHPVITVVSMRAARSWQKS